MTQVDPPPARHQQHGARCANHGPSNGVGSPASGLHKKGPVPKTAMHKDPTQGKPGQGPLRVARTNPPPQPLLQPFFPPKCQSNPVQSSQSVSPLSHLEQEERKTAGKAGKLAPRQNNSVPSQGSSFCRPYQWLFPCAGMTRGWVARLPAGLVDFFHLAAASRMDGQIDQ